ncbi:MFS transporter [Cohnella terricola]|uniref:MFS transporter n=1 Tax=Cohnella terricola TaxID=1289167 RepID=A0A559JT53_9BACL|nr:MFS transporter [Cohnella terricola]TVY03062.1 MFS transporter [Cohnella terricola]
MLTKSFHRLWLSQALSTLGDIWYILALVATLYHLSGSAFITVLYPLLRVAGMTVGSTFAPVITPKFRLSRLLSVCLGGQTLGLGLLAAYMLMFGEEHLNVALLVCMVFLISILEGIAIPVRSSLVPLTVAEDSLLKANGVLTGVVQSCSLAGWALGSIVVSWLGVGQVLIFSAFLLCGAWSVSSLIRECGAVLSEASGTDSWFRSIQAGWRQYFRVPKLRVLLWMNAWETLFGAVFAGALLLVFVGERLHSGEIWWGWINGAYLGGFVIVSLFISRLSGHIRNLGMMLAVGSGCYALLTLGFGFTSSPFAALGVMLILGASQSVKDLAERTLYQTSVPASELPPLLAAQSSLISLLYGVSLLLCGWIADSLGIQTLYFIAAAGFAVSSAGAVTFLLVYGSRQKKTVTSQ